MQLTPVIGVKYCTTTGGKYDVWLVAQAINCFRFLAAKTLLTFDLENSRNADACSRGYFVIAVDEPRFHALRQQTTYSRLAGPHESD